MRKTQKNEINTSSSY